jgi:hypothetical protein
MSKLDREGWGYRAARSQRDVGLQHYEWEDRLSPPRSYFEVVMSSLFFAVISATVFLWIIGAF